MRTINILSKLTASLKANPSVASTFPWDDVKLCVLAELECRSELYTPAQKSHLNQLLTDAFSITASDTISPYTTDAVIFLLEKILFALELLPESEHASELLSQANFDHACLNHYKNDTLIVLGDSHVNFFSGNEELSFLPIGNDINTCPINTGYPFTPLHIGPCLAYNCNRLNTSFRFKEKTEYLFQNFIKPHARILCCLGEIDIRVHVFQQTYLQGKSYEQIIDDILVQYIRFLTHLSERGYHVSCWGPIASQKDNCPLDPDFPRTGSETERNRATEYFTLQLSRLCHEHGIPFLSIFEQMISSDYQTLDEYLSPDHCHLSQKALPLAEKQWSKILFSCSDPNL